MSTDELAAALLAILPPHVGGLTVERNPGRTSYETVVTWLDGFDGGLSDGEPRWPSTEARQRAIDANDVWTARWYPQTPVGFCDAAAPTLAELLEMMRSA